MSDAEKVRNQVVEAASFLAPLPPIYRFAATNPLEGFVGMQFEEAVRVSRELLALEGFSQTSAHQVRTLCDLLDDYDDRLGLTLKVNRKAVRYIGAYCDKTQAQWSMERTGGLLNSWRLLAKHDLSLGRQWKKLLFDELSNESPYAALGQLLDILGIDESEATIYLRRHLFQLPGWASHLKWRQSQGEESILCEYLVMRIFYEVAAAQPVLTRRFALTDRLWANLQLLLAEDSSNQSSQIGHAHSASCSCHFNEPVARRGEEFEYQTGLLNKMSNVQLPGRSSYDSASSPGRPDVQICFCIDVREERFRRQLEIVGGHRYQTYGAAGFFGVPMQLTESGSKMSRFLCPVIVKPSKKVQEVHDSQLQVSRHALWAFCMMLQKKLKANLSSAFGFVDIVGPVYAFALLFRTFFPGLVDSVVRKTRQTIQKEDSHTLHTHLNISSFTLPEKVAMAHGLLASIGLTDNFAETVVFCGHESTSSNNPYAAALDCGACGGNTGRFNARVLADILNDRSVQRGLNDKGITVPESTFFVGAVHNTGTDQVQVFSHPLPESHKYAMELFEADLKTAGEKVRAERKEVLPRPLFERFNEPARRSCDPAQVIPELGLLGNRAMIVGPRSLSRDINLEGQVFLHSYEWQDDPSGAVLESIVSAAVVVASGINLQYYTSAMDNRSYGSGNKVTLNPFGGIGVMQGLRGDLKIGLTEQSVQVQDGLPLDVPLRLLVVIRAPVARINQALLKDSGVATLVKNGWFSLVGFDPETESFSRCEQVGDWKLVEKAA